MSLPDSADAYVDGVRAPVLQVNGLFRGVYLPGGKHTIVFTYAPLSLTIGLLLSGLSALGCGAWIVFTASRQLYGMYSWRGARDTRVLTPTNFAGNKES